MVGDSAYTSKEMVIKKINKNREKDKYHFHGFKMRRIYESSIKRNSGEQNNIHYVIYWICIDNMANPDCNIDARLL